MFNKEGYPFLTSHPNLNALSGAGNFFNLTADELFHLFVPGYQDPVYMGIPLGENATPSDLANNIYEFVSIKEAENTMDVIQANIKNNKDRKIIKRYKHKNAA